MKGKKLGFCFVICVLTVFFLAEESFSLGISVNRLIEFEPSLEDDYKLCVRNSRDVSQEIEFNIVGSLAKYMYMNVDDKVILSPKQTMCTSYHVKLPEKFEKPGMHTATVEVKEVPKRTFKGGINFNIIVAVNHIFSVRVPYPGKYVDFDLATWDIKENEIAYFTVQAIGRGTETIERISGTADIYQLAKNGKVGSVEFSEIRDLKNAETKEMYAEWDSTGQKSGDYKVVVNLDYDEKKEELEKTFRIGTLRFDIINYTKELYNGTINIFDIEVESQWNDDIKNVYAEVELERGFYKSSFKTPQENVKGWKRKTLTGYWDGKDAKLGEYDVTIKLHYAGKTTVEEGIVNVVEKGFETEKPTPSLFNTTTLLIVVIIIIVLFDIIWFLKKKKK